MNSDLWRGSWRVSPQSSSPGTPAAVCLPDQRLPVCANERRYEKMIRVRAFCYSDILSQASKIHTNTQAHKHTSTHTHTHTHRVRTLNSPIWQLTLINGVFLYQPKQRFLSTASCIWSGCRRTLSASTE